MRRLIILVAFAFLVGGGAVLTAAQTGNESQTEQTEAGADVAGCASPVASPASSPEVAETAAVVATAIASPHASPAALGIDPCATPEVGTPASGG
jgi:hypothetical protein